MGFCWQRGSTALLPCKRPASASLLEPLASIARLDPLRPISADGKLWYAQPSRPSGCPNFV